MFLEVLLYSALNMGWSQSAGKGTQQRETDAMWSRGLVTQPRHPRAGLNVDRRRWLWPKPVTWAQRLCFETEGRAHPRLTSTPWPVGLLHDSVPKTSTVLAQGKNIVTLLVDWLPENSPQIAEPAYSFNRQGNWSPESWVTSPCHATNQGQSHPGT